MTCLRLAGRLSLVLSGLMLLAAGCGGAVAPSSCPNDAPDTCPPSAATYTMVSPILQSRCAACHVAGGVESVRPFQTYDQVKRQTMDIFLSVSACIMPPSDQAQPTSDERQAILSWIVCGANND